MFLRSAQAEVIRRLESAHLELSRWNTPGGAQENEGLQLTRLVSGKAGFQHWDLKSATTMSLTFQATERRVSFLSRNATDRKQFHLLDRFHFLLETQSSFQVIWDKFSTISLQHVEITSEGLEIVCFFPAKSLWQQITLRMWMSDQPHKQLRH